MKKIFYSFICLCISVCIASKADGQALSKHEARQLIEKTMTCLKNSDTLSFIKQWQLDNAAWPYHNRPFDSVELKGHFAELRKFLDTAITRNLKIEAIEIFRQDNGNKKNYWAKYKIRGWFYYDKSYRKGIAFNVDYINGNWLYRFEPDYSTQTMK